MALATLFGLLCVASAISIEHPPFSRGVSGYFSILAVACVATAYDILTLYFRSKK